MRVLIASLFLLAACSKVDPNVPPVVPENRTFAFKVENVDVKDGVAPTSAAVAVEKAKIETIIKLSKGTK